MKRMLTLALAALLTVGCLVPLSSASEPLDFSFGMKALPCYYTDDYFSHSAEVYQPQLATMSISLAMTTMRGDPRDAEALLEEIGMQEIAANDDFRSTPETDSIGVIVGSKQLDDSVLLAVAIRSGGYGSEWASNVTVGAEGDHAGFAGAREQVLSFLREYVAQRELTGTLKLWVTGYSRGAAVANLVGAALTEGTALSNVEAVYAYCFAAPAGAAEPKAYANIFNILNPADPIVYVAPAEMGFGRHGLDLYFPSAGKQYAAAQAAMLERLERLSPAYSLRDFQMQTMNIDSDDALMQEDNSRRLPAGVFLPEFMALLSACVDSREGYAQNFEAELAGLLGFLTGLTPEELERFGEEMDMDVEMGGSVPMEAVSDRVIAALDAAEIAYNSELIREAGKKLTALAVLLAASDPNAVATMLVNFSALVAGHDPLLYFAWLTSMDSNYQENARLALTDGTYRLARTDGDFRVLDESGALVAAVTDGEPLENSALYCGVDKDGRYYALLPADMDYEMQITARKDGALYYSAAEYSAGTLLREMTYAQIQADGTLRAVLPALAAGERTDYALYAPDGTRIPERAAETSTEVFCKVTAVASDASLGAVSGGGDYAYEAEVLLSAAANEGCQFVGWYQGEARVSEAADYRFAVTEDIALTARFEEAPKGNSWLPAVCAVFSVCLIFAVLLVRKRRKAA